MTQAFSIFRDEVTTIRYAYSKNSHHHCRMMPRASRFMQQPLLGCRVVETAAWGDPAVAEAVPHSRDVFDIGVVVQHGRVIGDGVRRGDGVDGANRADESGMPSSVLDVEGKFGGRVVLAFRERGEVVADCVVVISVPRAEPDLDDYWRAGEDRPQRYRRGHLCHCPAHRRLLEPLPHAVVNDEALSSPGMRDIAGCAHGSLARDRDGDLRGVGVQVERCEAFHRTGLSPTHDHLAQGVVDGESDRVDAQRFPR